MWTILLILQIPRPTSDLLTRITGTGNRLEIYRFRKQVILMLLTVQESLILDESLRSNLSQRSMTLEEGELGLGE